MDNKKWKVYVHINKENLKKYVGVTSKEKVEHRWNGGRGYKENTHFYAAIQKYGWENFYHIVLYNNLSEDEAKQLECFLISYWKTQNNAFGYNMTAGGDGTKGYHPSKETRARLSKARLKENLSKETLERRSKGLKGRKFSQEHKDKIGKANSKAVQMISKNGESIRIFNSLQEAEETLNISHSHISQCCHGSRKTAGGYCWQFI